jgi:hypothetical protein
MVFSSSRTLPGQSWRRSDLHQTFGEFLGLMAARLRRSRKDLASSGMSSRRSRRGRHMDVHDVEPEVQIHAEAVGEHLAS